MDGKPTVQMFAEDLAELVTRYQDSGLTNAEAVGVLSMYNFDLKYKIRRDAEIGE